MSQKLSLGIDLGGTNTSLGIVSSQGQVLQFMSFESCVGQGPQDWIERVSGQIHQLLLSAKTPPKSIHGIGIGVAGLVDQSKGSLLYSPNFPRWDHTSIATLLSQRMKIPVSVDNDVNAMALGEMLFGSARGLKNVICMTLGTGVGGGIILDGKIYRGEQFSAGEVGHMTLFPYGPRCSCGNRGCIEVYASSRGILRKAKEQLRRDTHSLLSKKLQQEELTVKLISDCAKQNCSVSKMILGKTAEYLGIFIAGLVNAWNPSAIVIGGRIAQAGDNLFRPLKLTVKQRAMEVPFRGVRIVPAGLKFKAGIVGAAMLPMGFAKVFHRFH
jgi:glucokinase